MVVFGIAEGDDIVRRDTNALQLEAHVADRVQHGGLVRLHRGDDHLSDGERLDLLLLQRADELVRRRIAVRLSLARRRIVNEGAVLGDDARAHLRFRKNAQQVVELAGARAFTVSGATRPPRASVSSKSQARTRYRTTPPV